MSDSDSDIIMHGAEDAPALTTPIVVESQEPVTGAAEAGEAVPEAEGKEGEEVDTGKKKPLPPAQKERKVNRVSVSRIPETMTRERVQEIFEEYGKIDEINMPMKMRGNGHKRYAFVQYMSFSDAKYAVKILTSRVVDGVTLNVSMALPKHEYQAKLEAAKKVEVDAAVARKDDRAARHEQTMKDHQTAKAARLAAKEEARKQKELDRIENLKQDVKDASLSKAERRAAKKALTKANHALRKAAKEAKKASKITTKKKTEMVHNPVKEEKKEEPSNNGENRPPPLPESGSASAFSSANSTGVESFGTGLNPYASFMGETVQNISVSEFLTPEEARKKAEIEGTDPEIAIRDAIRAEERSRSVFVRNLSFDTTKAEIEETFNTSIGNSGAVLKAVERVLLVLDPNTRQPRGTAFVLMRERWMVKKIAAAAFSKTGFDVLDRDGKEVPRHRHVTDVTLEKSEFVTSKYGIEDDEPSPGLYVRNRRIGATAALSKDEAEKARQAHERKREEEKNRDTRNVYLAQEGYIDPESEAGMALSEEDAAKRAKARRDKREMLDNPNYFVSDTRVSLRNIPLHITEDEIKELAMHAGAGFILDSGRLDVETKRPLSAFPEIKQVKIVRDKERLVDGLGRSKGYGFVEFLDHEPALRCLRLLNNNPKYYSPKRRLIVEFALEDARAIRKHLMRVERSAAKAAGKTGDEGLSYRARKAQRDGRTAQKKQGLTAGWKEDAGMSGKSSWGADGEGQASGKITLQHESTRGKVWEKKERDSADGAAPRSKRTPRASSWEDEAEEEYSGKRREAGKSRRSAKSHGPTSEEMLMARREKLLSATKVDNLLF